MNTEKPAQMTEEEIQAILKEDYIRSGGAMLMGETVAEYRKRKEEEWNKMHPEKAEQREVKIVNPEPILDIKDEDDLQQQAAGEQKIKDDEALKNVRQELGILDEKQKREGINDEDYGKFRVKNGETDVGVYWFEYGNIAAKRLKESGKLKWGKERIYFDIPLADMYKLRDLAFLVAKNEKIPIAFKYLDTSKTDQVDLKPDSETTRFVANFASVEDAKKFYEALQKEGEYKGLKSDRNLDYHGLNLDGVAHYASGYREQREPLTRIIKTAKKNTDNTYSYYSADGSRKITITEAEYQVFEKQLQAIPKPEDSWKNAI